MGSKKKEIVMKNIGLIKVVIIGYHEANKLKLQTNKNTKTSKNKHENGQSAGQQNMKIMKQNSRKSPLLARNTQGLST